jgi:Thioesterase-like superfamily
VSPQSTVPTPFFTVDGDTYVPGPLAAGPWADAVSGPIIGGLLGRTIERDAGDPDLQPARLTVDLPRPTLLEPVAVQTVVIREGRRIKLVDAVVLQRGQVTARASALFLRRSAQPDGQVWSAPIAMPALPTEPDGLVPDLQMQLWAYGAGPTSGMPRVEWQRECSPKFVWVRQLRPLIEGEALTPFTNAAMAADVTSALTHWGTDGLRFVNADFTLTLSRLPEGPHIGLASIGHHSAAGVASGVATLFDHLGPIGTGVAVALANTTATFTPRNLAI